MGVLDRLLWGVDGAGADDDKDAVIVTGEDACSGEAGGGNGVERGLGRDDLMSEKRWLEEGVVLSVRIGNGIGWEGGAGGEIRCEMGVAGGAR